MPSGSTPATVSASATITPVRSLPAAQCTIAAPSEVAMDRSAPVTASRGPGPSSSTSAVVRRSTTVVTPISSTSLLTSAGDSSCRFSERSSRPYLVSPPSSVGSPPTSRTLTAPSRSIHTMSLLSQIGQDGQDAAVVVVGLLQVQLGEDRRGVLGDRALGDDQTGGDRRVGAAFGHQPKDLALARAQPGQRPFGGVAGQQARDDLGVHGCAPVGDPLDRVGELSAVEHPVFQQVPDGASAVGQQLTGVELLDVLGQHQDRQAGHLVARPQRGAQPLVGERRRQPDVHHRHVGRARADGGEEVRAVVDGGGDLEAVGLQQPDQAVAEQEQVLGYDNAHGTSIVTSVGPPAGLDTTSTPSKAASLRPTPASPVPRDGSAPPSPSSDTLMRKLPEEWRRSTSAPLAPACLATLASSSLTAK